LAWDVRWCDALNSFTSDNARDLEYAAKPSEIDYALCEVTIVVHDVGKEEYPEQLSTACTFFATSRLERVYVS
jgi:hypothetical protein